MAKSSDKLNNGANPLAIDPAIALAGLVVGFVVGLTGMGGGALTTPMLVLVFGVQPLAAVSSDLVAAVVMKPIGGAVHLSRGTVRRDVVRWLMLGSIPAAFSGALLVRVLGNGHDVQNAIETMLGIALVVGSVGIAARALLGRSRHDATEEPPASRMRAALTVGVGVLGGLIVGLTSVGSGSIMLVLLMVLYPRLTTRELVGTDLVQAVPLVASAALGHLLFGDFRFGLTASLLIGSVPGVYVGARLVIARERRRHPAGARAGAPALRCEAARRPEPGRSPACSAARRCSAWPSCPIAPRAPVSPPPRSAAGSSSNSRSRWSRSR